MMIRRTIIGCLVLWTVFLFGMTLEAEAAPDLVVNHLEGPTTVPSTPPNNSFYVTVEVTNQGPDDAGPFRVGYYFSTDPTITTSDYFFGFCDFPGLAAGNKLGCACPLGPCFAVPGLGLGVYYLGAITDIQGTVSESNEANNTRIADTGQVTITAGTETVSAPFNPSGPASGTVGTSYSFITGGAVSSLGHLIQYRFTWGDGTDSGWLPLGTISASKTWGASGTFPVQAQARCSIDTSAVSGLSGILNVTLNNPPPPSGCSYSISPTSNTLAGGAGTGTVNVTAGPGCPWTASTTPGSWDWVGISSGASGTGNGTVTYSVLPNNSGSPRTGTLTIAGQTFTVTQGGL